MVVDRFVLDMIKRSVFSEDRGLKPVETANPVNQALSVSTLNLESGAYAPAAVSQFDVSGMDTVNLENEDIRIVLDTKTGLYRFKNNTARDWLKGSSGTLVSSPTVTDKELSVLRYQGYDTVDVSGGQ